MLLSRRIPDGIYSVYWKMPNAAEQQAGFLATVEHLLDPAHASFHLTQKWYKRDFNRRFYRGRIRIRYGDYVFIDALDGVTKTPKSTHAVKRS